MERKPIFGVNPNVFFLGVVSFLTDVSSEIIFTLLPLFLANVMGVTTPIIGLIVGIADSTASLVRIVSGWLSDRLGKRKFLAFSGYLLSTIAKPFMYVASTWGFVLGVRFTDRLGKGIRTAPRDALIADSVLVGERGRAFGLHRALDTYGTVLGLAVAAIVVYLAQRGTLELLWSTYQWLVIVGVMPAVLALFGFLFVREVKKEAKKPVTVVTNKDLKTGFDARFKLFLAIIFLFTLGNFSDAFLILRAQNLGNSVLYILLMLVVFNIIYASVATPAGILSDKLGRKRVLVLGWLIYALVYFGFATASASWQVWFLFGLYGLYYGLVDGVSRAFVADLVPQEKRGTAYGLYHSVVGVTLLPASLIAGWLWHVVAPSAPFYFGAGMAIVAMLGLWILIRE